MPRSWARGRLVVGVRAARQPQVAGPLRAPGLVPLVLELVQEPDQAAAVPAEAWVRRPEALPREAALREAEVPPVGLALAPGFPEPVTNALAWPPAQSCRGSSSNSSNEGAWGVRVPRRARTAYPTAAATASHALRPRAAGASLFQRIQQFFVLLESGLAGSDGLWTCSQSPPGDAIRCGRAASSARPSFKTRPRHPRSALQWGPPRVGGTRRRYSSSRAVRR